MPQAQQETKPAGRRTPENASQARERVRGVLRTRFASPGGGVALDELLVADVLLVTSELVSNAIRHGGGLTGFAAVLTADGILLTVTDRSDDLPRTGAGTAAPGAPGGYGWPIVGRLAESLETTLLVGGGKRIRAFVRLDRPRPA